MTANVANQYQAHATNIQNGQAPTPTASIGVEFFADRPPVANLFGLSGLTSGEVVSITTEAIKALAQVAQQYNAKAGN